MQNKLKALAGMKQAGINRTSTMRTELSIHERASNMQRKVQLNPYFMLEEIPNYKLHIVPSQKLKKDFDY
jgi:hypothetical protein